MALSKAYQRKEKASFCLIQIFANERGKKKTTFPSYEYLTCESPFCPTLLSARKFYSSAAAIGQISKFESTYVPTSIILVIPYLVLVLVRYQYRYHSTEILEGFIRYGSSYDPKNV